MKLHEQVKLLKANNTILTAGYQSILSYVNSPKYSQSDGMVNRGDVELRIHEILNEISHIQ